MTFRREFFEAFWTINKRKLHGKGKLERKLNENIEMFVEYDYFTNFQVTALP